MNSGVKVMESGEEFELLCDVFKGYDEYELKTKGQRIRKIIRKATYGIKCFYITREDGTEMCISYYSCLDSNKNKK